MHADEVNKNSSKSRQDQKKGDSEDRDDLSTPNKKPAKRRERGGQRDRRKKQNAARFPKKQSPDERVVTVAQNNKSKDEDGTESATISHVDVPKIKIKQRERQSSTNEQQQQQQQQNTSQQQQQMQRPRQVTNIMRRELLHFELKRLRESESRTPIKPKKMSKMTRRKERKKRAKQTRNNPSKVTAYSNPNISKDDEFIFVHLAAFSSKNNRQFIPSVLKDLEKYKSVSDAYAQHDFRTHHIIFDEETQTYFCQICLMSFPNKENALHHCYKDGYHKNLKSKVFELENARLAGSKFPLDENPDRLAMLNAELQSILDKRLNSNDFHKRTECFERIAAILKKFQPDIKVQLYGSTAYEAVLETSDINICVSNEGTRANTLLSQIFYFLKDLTNDPDAKLRAVRDNFYASGAMSSVGFTPHVAAFDLETGIKLTIIGADHDRTSRIKTANLIKFYLTYEPKIQRLALIFRQWANWCGLDEPDNGTLPAFNLVLCVIYFFQKKRWVPFLHEKTDCNLMIIPYRFENGKCFIRRLKSSEKASVNEVTSSKKDETTVVEIKKDEQQKDQQEIQKATSCASSDDEIDSCELIFEDDTIDSTSEPPTIEQETVTETETVETKTEAIIDEEELEDEESLLEGSSVPKDMCLGKLLAEFFNFIAYEINYEKDVISIRERNLTRGSLNLGVKRIAVQDPFNPTKNAARTMSSPANFEFWKAKLRVTYGRLFIGPNELRKMIHANKFEHIKPGIERVELQVLRDREPDNKLVEVKSDAGLEVFVEDGETELTDKVSKLNLDSGKERKRGSVKLNPRLLNHINNYIAADKSRTPSPKISPRDATSSPILTSEKKGETPSAEDDLETPRPSEESTLEESKATSDEDDDSGSSDGNEDSNNDTGSELDYEPSEVIASVCSKLQSINDPIFKRMTAVFDRECVATGPLPKRLCGLCRSENCLGDNCPDDIDRVRLEELPEMKTTDYAWLDGVLMKIYRRKKPTEKEVNQRERALKFIQNFMEMNFDKNSRLELFGSSRNGFGFSGSDLDICLTFAGHDTEPPEMYSDAVDVIKGVAAAFKSNSFFSNIVAITQAKVPIVKFDLHLDNSLKFEADISYYNVLAKRNTKLLRTYCLLDSRCEVLGYLVKAMVKEVGIGDASRGSLSSYAYTLMMIHFLQHEGVLPVLQELHDCEKRPEFIIEGFNTWFQEDPIRIAEFMNSRTDAQTNDCLSKLWVKFFRYYTEDFNFERDVVQCQQSGRLSLFEKEWTSKCISIEDPFDYNHNLGAGVSRKMANYIISVLRRARQVFGSFDISIYKKPPITPEVLNPDVFCEILISKALLTNGEEVPNDRCCRICGKIGHFIKDCPLSSRNRRLAEKNGNVVETPPRPCFVCNQVGHLKKDCPNKDSRRQQRSYKNYDRLQNAPKLDLDGQNQQDSRYRRYNQGQQQSPQKNSAENRAPRPSGQVQFRPSPLARQSGVMLQHNLAQLKFEHGNDLNSTVNRLNRADALYYQNVRNTMAIHQNMQARQRAESELHQQQRQNAAAERPRTYTG